MVPVSIKSAFRSRSLKCLLVTTAIVSTFLLSAIYVNNESENFYATQGSHLSNTLKKLREIVFSFKAQADPPIILIWTTYFSKEHWLPELKDLKCQWPCTISYDRNVVNFSDAVVFHLRDVNPQDLPKWRTENQLWLLFNKEAPPHTPANLIAALQSKINLTATYRRDSDIFAPYGSVVERRTFDDIIDLKPKTSIKSWKKGGFVCWIVSHCETPSRREVYVDMLKRYIPVRVYGVCGERSCRTTNVYKCYARISPSCKFYLSFENSLCRDYVTEKLYNALQSGMVPVVMGSVDYSSFLPNHSFINVEDYNSPKDLATHLWQLHKNDKMYRAYHEWRYYYEVKDTSFLWLCDLCQKLHRSKPGDKFGKRIDKWWFGNNTCQTWQEYFGLR